MKIITFFKGKKSYIVSLVTLLYAVVIVGWQQGDWSSATPIIFGSLGLGALRNAIK